jgi:lipid-A-disaccharide synthase
MNGNDSAGGPLIYLAVGEPSGDQLGAHLVAALRERTGGKVRFAGLAGPRMAEQGLSSLFPIDDLAVMGVEFLPKLRLILRRIREVADDIRAKQPDCAVLIDSQGFSHRVAKRLRASGIPVIQYVAPTVWAWNEGRARRVARCLDHLLTIFPFEAPYFERHGLATTFVGHPAAERADIAADGAALRRRLGIPDDAPVLCVLPGSRLSEVRRHTPVFADALRRIAAAVPGLHCLVPTVPAVAEPVEEAARSWPEATTVLRDTADKYAAFAASNAALAASGTATVELAFADVPTVVSYKLSWHAAQVGRLILKTPFVCAVNVVMDREVMPEFVLDRCEPAGIAEAVTALLTDPSTVMVQRRYLAEARQRLRAGHATPSAIAAAAILSLIDMDEKEVQGS